VKIKVGLITGIIGREVAQDPWGTLEQVRQIGYQGLEIGPGFFKKAQMSPTALKRRLNGMGLQITSYGTLLDAMQTDLDNVIEHAKAVDVPYVVLFWAPCESREAALAQAAELDVIGARLQEHGLTLCYHNHDHEFRRFDDQVGLDILLSHTDPGRVQAEIDVAWVRFGGADPGAYIRKYKNRCPLIHVKDIYTDAFRGAWTEVGTGIVDLRDVLQAGVESGVDWFIVEQDRPRDLSPMESIRVSFGNLEQTWCDLSPDRASG
jgi:sugar phosphate isomerase/epimerase